MNREIKFRAWDKSCNKMRGISGLQDCFSLRSDGVCNEDYILMQYTGLKDKNGKEIYEGDAIRYKNYNGFSVIRYEKGSFFFYGISVIHFLFNVKGKDIEVIGNIYENPEFTQSSE